jgi:hypothetical protein
MKKTGMLILAIIIVLGSLGVGFAAWSQSLTITANVATGNLDLVLESPTNPAGAGNTFTISADGHSGTITITGMYPGYDSGALLFNVHNVGTVPALTGIAMGTITTDGVDGALASDLTVTVNPLSPVNIPAGTIDSTDFAIRIVMNSTVEHSMNATYTIPFTITGAQNTP